MGSPGRTCAVCGRTILAGEQVRGYVSDSGPRIVCELCVARAERLGWMTEAETERGGQPGRGSARQRRGLGGLLRRRQRTRPEPDSADLDFDFEPELEAEEPTVAAPTPEAGALAAEPESRDPEPAEFHDPDPAAPGRRPASPPPDAFLPSPFERAVARFNASEAGHTVVGLTRTLGRPWVSVGALAGVPSEVRITVAWELSWYQWGVDLGDELRPVFQLDKGQEISQLDPAARQWNASADEEGRIVLTAPAGAGTAPR